MRQVLATAGAASMQKSLLLLPTEWQLSLLGFPSLTCTVVGKSSSLDFAGDRASVH